MSADLVTEYVSDLMSGVEQRMGERAIDPPESAPLDQVTLDDAADGFDALDNMARKWVEDRIENDEIAEVVLAAIWYCTSSPSERGRRLTHLLAAYRELRSRYVDEMAGEYE